MEKDKFIVSKVSGIVKKVDSNNTEVIIKTHDGNLFFLYFNKEFVKDDIVNFVKEGDLIFKGDTIMEVKCGYNKEDITTLEMKSKIIGDIFE